MALPSYEEAVYGSGGPGDDSGVPPSPSPPPPPAPPETRVPIVLSEGLPQGASGGQSASRARLSRDLDFCLPSTSSLTSFSSRRHAETVLDHQAPCSSSSSSSSWAREHPGGACAGPLPLRRDSGSSDQHSVLSITSTDDFSDGERKRVLHTMSLLQRERQIPILLFDKSAVFSFYTNTKCTPYWDRFFNIIITKLF